MNKIWDIEQNILLPQQITYNTLKNERIAIGLSYVKNDNHNNNKCIWNSITCHIYIFKKEYNR